MNPTTLQCFKCDNSCRSCSMTSYNCTDCNAPYLIGYNNGQGSCIMNSSCPLDGCLTCLNVEQNQGYFCN